MTKEEFKNKIGACVYWEEVSPIVDEFFKSNIVIPKGKNRHPYADVLHAYAEGATIQSKSSSEWYDVFMHDEYRIKPSESVYEWQWLVEDIMTKEQFIPQGHHILDELLLEKSIVVIRKIEETKRERKQ